MVGAMFERGPLFRDGLTAAGFGWSEEGDEAANRAHGIASQCDMRSRALMRLERLKVADSLGLGQHAEGVGFSRDRQIGLHGIDQFEEEPAVCAPLV